MAADSEEDLELLCKTLKDKNSQLQNQLNETLSEVAVAAVVKESMVELERQKKSLESEVTTLQQLLNENHDESASIRTRYEHEIARIKAVAQQLEQENKELRAGSGGTDLGSGAGEDRDALLALNDVTKSLVRKVKLNFHSAVGKDKIVSPTSPIAVPAVNSTTGQDEDCQMQKAQEDTELLKAIVLPLEEQIVALKQKLRETDQLLVESERRQSKTILGKKSSYAMKKI